MTRIYRPNQQRSLKGILPPSSPQQRRSTSLRSLCILGLVVNPRTREPLLVTTDGENVGIRSLKEGGVGVRHGSGYYDTSGHGKSKEAENLTGFPRSHTPSGVTPLGQGYGTSLYTALCLGAYLVDNSHANIKMDVDGEGITSESEGRSHQADRWWDAAYRRGLTDREEEETEEEDRLDISVDADDLANCVDLEEGQTLTYVHGLDAEVTTTTTFAVDIYRYFVKGSGGRAWTSDLVLAEFYMNDLAEDLIPSDIPRGSELRWLRDLAEDDSDFWGDTNPEALLALDVRGLDREAMHLLSLCYAHADLKDSDISALWQRWKQNLDPSHEGQQYLFAPNSRGGALSSVAEARSEVAWDNLASLP